MYAVHCHCNCEDVMSIFLNYISISHRRYTTMFYKECIGQMFVDKIVELIQIGVICQPSYNSVL